MKSMNTIALALLGGVAAALLTTTTAFAAVTFDPALGGQVGKGDVQELIGTQVTAAVAEGVGFELTAQRKYAIDCSFETGPKSDPVTKVVTVSGMAKVKDSVLTEARKNRNSNVTGFLLEPVAIQWSDQVPVVGDECKLGGGGVIVGVEEGETTITLSVTYGGEKFPLN
jgi:hypothetical protein